jgi:hypothetical protein
MFLFSAIFPSSMASLIEPANQNKNVIVEDSTLKGDYESF